MIRAANLHLTLAFLGEVDAARLPALRLIAAGVQGEPFELMLDRITFWSHNRIVFAEPSIVPGALRELVAALGGALAQGGFRVDERRFAAHATLVRDARGAPVLDRAPAISWPVTSFALIESRHEQIGVVYRPIERWTLGERKAMLGAR